MLNGVIPPALGRDPRQANAPDVQFAGRRLNRILGVTGIALTTAAIPSAAMADTFSSDARTGESTACAQVIPGGQINNAEDLPNSVFQGDARVYDLANNPTFTPEQCANIDGVLQEILGND